MILEIYKGDMCHSMMEDAQTNFQNTKWDIIFTPTDPVPPEGDPSKDAPVSKGKLCTYLQIEQIVDVRNVTPTNPVPPEGDPSEDAPASRGKLRIYLQI